MKSQIKPRRFLFEYMQAAVIALIFSLGARTFLFQAFRIPSPSMEGTLLVGDHLLVNKFAFGATGSVVDKLLPFKDDCLFLGRRCGYI